MTATANDIRKEIMSMDYTDPKEVATALEHIADKLCDLEQELAEATKENQ